MGAKPDVIISDQQIENVKALSGYGLNNRQIADIVGISKRCFESKCASNPELLVALEKGRAVAASQVSQTAFNMAKSGNHPLMTMFWLKCREHWKDANSSPDTENERQEGHKKISDTQLLRVLK